MDTLDKALVDVRSNCWTVALLLLVATTGAAVAQDPTPGAILPTDARATGTKAHGVLLLPVLGAGPTFGVAGGAVAATAFRYDSASRRSGVGVGGIVAERSSWMLSVGGRVDFQRDNWRTLFGIGQYDVHYPFFGVGNAAGNADRSMIVRQKGNSDVFEALHRIIGPLYGGARFRFEDVSMGVKRGELLNPLVLHARVDSSVRTGALGVAGEYDTRDDDTAPRGGTFARGSAMYARSVFGSQRSINSYDLWVNQYVAVRHHDVLAFRVNLCATGDASPLWQLCTFGARNDLRGYTVGRYRDRGMFAVQAEYRAVVVGRFGASAFAGVGGVGPSLSDAIGDNLLVSGGPGIRYLVSRPSRLNVGIEYAFATHGGGAYYFRIGEAF